MLEQKVRIEGLRFGYLLSTFIATSSACAAGSKIAQKSESTFRGVTTCDNTTANRSRANICREGLVEVQTLTWKRGVSEFPAPSPQFPLQFSIGPPNFSEEIFCLIFHPFLWRSGGRCFTNEAQTRGCDALPAPWVGGGQQLCSRTKSCTL